MIEPGRYPCGCPRPQSTALRDVIHRACVAADGHRVPHVIRPSAWDRPAPETPTASGSFTFEGFIALLAHTIDYRDTRCLTGRHYEHHGMTCDQIGDRPWQPVYGYRTEAEFDANPPQFTGLLGDTTTED